MQFPAKRATVYTVAFVLFIVVFAYLLLNYTRRVDGVSMKPTLEQGDLVVIVPASMSDVHIGDIIVYGPPCSAEGDSVIHRVVSGNVSSGFYTQGDDRATNPGTDQSIGIADEPIVQACLVGKVVFIVPYIERLAALPYGLNYIIAGIIFLMILVSEIAARTTKDEPEPSGATAGEAGQNNGSSAAAAPKRG